MSMLAIRLRAEHDKLHRFRRAVSQSLVRRHAYYSPEGAQGRTMMRLCGEAEQSLYRAAQHLEAMRRG